MHLHNLKTLIGTLNDNMKIT